MIKTGGHNVFVASAYRSGSTHVAHVLGQLLQFRPVSSAGLHGEGVETQNINPYTFSVLAPYGFQIFHQHCPATAGNVELLRQANIRPIVPIRNVADTLVSVRERIIRIGPVLPGVVVPAGLVDWTEPDQYSWLVDNVAPWLFQFYVSWASTDLPHRLVKFSDFFADQVGSIQLLFDWLEVERPDKKLIKEACGANWNKNVGDNGRGYKCLEAEHLERLRGIANNYGQFWVGQFDEAGLI